MSETPQNQNSSTEYLPKIGMWTTLAIVVGAVIGSGIFKKPALMADQLGSPEVLLLVWLVAGILTLFGALSNAEVAGMITATGGQYVFFEKMYGKFVSFMYGWSIFAVIQTGSIASITYVFSQYFEFFYILPRFDSEFERQILLKIPFIGTIYPLEDIGVKSLTICVIFFLSVVNYLGVRFGGALSSLFTGLKLLAIFLLVAFGFAYWDGSASNLLSSADGGSTMLQKAGFAGLIGALSGAFWAYDGWNNITYIAGEVKNPQKTIPRSLFLGAIIIIGVYMLINVAFLYVLPIEEMAKSQLVAADAAVKSMGAIGAAFVSAAVMVSTFGTSNGTIMVSARVYYAMAKNKMFFPSIGKSHQKFKTPANALLLQAGWSALLVLTGTFDTLTDMLIFVSWIFYAIGAMGVFVLRKKMPDAERPYKVWGYPYVPAIFTIFATGFVILTLINDITAYQAGETELINSIFGLFLCASGLPFYYYWRRK